MTTEKETVRLSASTPLRAGRLRLLALGPDGSMSTHVLPERGDLEIGRSQDVDLQIDDPSISRRHVILHVSEILRLEDLGSANGTRVRDRRLDAGETLTLEAGDVVEIGQTVLVVQREAPPVKPLRLISMDYFAARVDDECGRGERSSTQFAVARLETAAASESALHTAIAESIRPGDVVALAAPGAFLVLLVDSDEAAAQGWTRETAGSAASVAETRSGVANYPGAAREGSALIARATSVLATVAPSERRPEVTARPGQAMAQMRRLIERVATSSISVMLLGETGVGKSVLANEIHTRSPRANVPILSLNCAAFTESLLESELFGYERGAFTGALQAKPGLLETADGGTVFLDEIGEMPLSLQSKLLRVIEEREVRRIGGLKSKKIDVRILSATNRDLEADSVRGTFRQDLYFRLNGVSLTLPPLRERTAEIEGFSRQFAKDAYAREKRTGEPELLPETLEALKRHPWPGNIRELRNVIDRAVMMSGEGPIGLDALPEDSLRHAIAAARRLAPTTAIDDSSEVTPEPVTLPPPPSPAGSTSDARSTEKQRILDALEQCAGNQSRAAEVLGISRRTLVTRLDEFDIPRPRKSSGD